MRSMTTLGKGLPQVSHKRSSGFVRENNASNYPPLVWDFSPSSKTDLAINRIDNDAVGKGIHDDDGLRQGRRFVFAGHYQTSLVSRGFAARGYLRGIKKCGRDYIAPIDNGNGK